MNRLHSTSIKGIPLRHLLPLILLLLVGCSGKAQPDHTHELPVVTPAWPTFPLLDSAALRYEKEIHGYELLDSMQSGPQQVDVVMTGSSSIVSWKTMQADLSPLPVLGRGFGGSTLLHCAYYAHRVVFPYQPKLVVIYAGENDIAYEQNKGHSSGYLDSLPLVSLQQYVQHLHAALPDARLLYLSMKPSPARAKLWPHFQRGNALIRQWMETQPMLSYLDVATPMLDAEGQPRPELFTKDKLHMNAEGYALWTPLVREAIQRQLLLISPDKN